MITCAALFIVAIPFIAFVLFIMNKEIKYEQQKKRCEERMKNDGANEGAQAMLGYVLGNGKSSKEFWNDYEKIYKRECENYKDESEDE